MEKRNKKERIKNKNTFNEAGRIKTFELITKKVLPQNKRSKFHNLIKIFQNFESHKSLDHISSHI